MSICENHKHISKKFKEFTYNKDKKHHRFLLKRSAKPEDNKMFYVTLLGEQSWKLVFCFLQTLSMDFWAPKNWCFWTVVLEKTLGSPLDCKEIQPVHSEGDQLWDSFGRNDAEAETPVLWPPHAKSWLIGKDSDSGRDWGQKEKGTTEDEMAGWHHWLDGRESEWTLGVGDGQGGLACCSSWSCKESDTTERLNWTESGFTSFHYNKSWVQLCVQSWESSWWTTTPKAVLETPDTLKLST